jgi:TRAP-type C4-dicarboxylate transport system permease small subunit
MNQPTTTNSLLERCVIWVGAAALILLGLLICASVVLRLTGSVIKGNSEIGEMLIIIVASTALVAATLTSAHPYVHMLVDKIATRWRYRLAAVIAAIGAVFWSVVAWMNGKIAIENAALIEETELLRISLTPFRTIWIISLLLVAAVLVAGVVQSLRASNEVIDESREP